MGIIKPIHAKYDLLPRGRYVWSGETPVPDTPKVSMDRYEAMSQLYQAQNALGIAQAAKADQYAPTTYAKARQLLAEAQRLEQSKDKAVLKRSVQSAREAAQTAEDARIIAERRSQEEKTQAEVTAAEQAALTAEMATRRAKQELEAAQQAKLNAQSEADRAKAAAAAARAEAEAERNARQQAEAQAARSNAPAVVVQQEDHLAAQQTSTRTRLLQELSAKFQTRDTPRGLVVTIPDTAFDRARVRDSLRVASVGAIVGSHPGLRVEVQGHTDIASTDWLARRRAEEVGSLLRAAGLSSGTVFARGLGSSSPLASNSTPQGREENRRVEIVISGDAIGHRALWDRTYTLQFRK
jgi:outer membrane protein OmpA-like peptidoglycan-associated protein